MVLTQLKKTSVKFFLGDLYEVRVTKRLVESLTFYKKGALNKLMK